jgi:anti-sigma factor RsiW
VRRLRVVPDLACRELVELVTDYLEDALPSGERERFEAHLAECDACDAYVEQVRATIRLAGRAAALEDPGETAALLEMFRGYRRAL